MDGPYTGIIYMNVSVTTVWGFEEQKEDDFMWCLYFFYMISICFVKTIFFFETELTRFKFR